MNERIRDYDINNNKLLNLDALKNRVIVFLRGRKRELFFNRDLFLDLEKYLFLEANTANAMFIEAEIRNGFRRWFPMITIEELEVTADEDKRSYKIELRLYANYLDESFELSERVALNA